MHESIERGARRDRAVPGDRRPLGRGHGDRLGRARARRARAATTSTPTRLAHYRDVARDMPDEGMRTFPEVDGGARRPAAGPTRSGAGDPRAPRPRRTTTTGQLGSADGCAAVGLALLQLGEVDGAIDVARTAATRAADDDGPRDGDRLPARARVRRRAPPRRRRRRDRRPRQRRAGGTYSDRMIALWAESFVRTQQRRTRRPRRVSTPPTRSRPRPTRRSSTRSPALARAKVLAALGDRRRRRRRRRRRAAARRARAHRRRLAADLRPRARRASRVPSYVTGAARGADRAPRRTRGRRRRSAHRAAPRRSSRRRGRPRRTGASGRRGGRAPCVDAAAGVRSSRSPVGVADHDPLVGEHLAHRVGAEHR